MASIATIAFTSCGRASAISQPAGPPSECVTSTAGPMRSSSSAPRDWSSACPSARSAGIDPLEATIERALPVEALAAPAVDQHQRIRLRDLDGRLPLDVHGRACDGAPRPVDALDADPEEAAAGGDRIAAGLK